MQILDQAATATGAPILMDDHARLKELMERWSAWRIQGFDVGIGWPRRTTLGRAMDGMPSTQCTLCHGRKQVPGHRVGALVPFVQCPQCRGEGKIKTDPSKIKANPAFIRSTSAGYEVDDPISELIDRVVAMQLKEKEKKVINAEYSWIGRQTDKARRVGYGYGLYIKLLSGAHGTIKSALRQAKVLYK